MKKYESNGEFTIVGRGKVFTVDIPKGGVLPTSKEVVLIDGNEWRVMAVEIATGALGRKEEVGLVVRECGGGKHG